MNLNKFFADEFRQESLATRKMLERVPNDKLGWKPHEKSAPLEYLAGHIAQLPNFLPMILNEEEFNLSPKTFAPFVPQSIPELLESFDQKVAAALEELNSDSGEKLQDIWRLRRGERIILEMPRANAIRWIISHVVHHRGQLAVYLRLLDVPLPPIYGPTADERLS